MNLDYRICTVPLVDAIDGDTYVFSPQAGGDDNGFARGAWDWDLLWKRIPLTKREKVRYRNHGSNPSIFLGSSNTDNRSLSISCNGWWSFCHL